MSDPIGPDLRDRLQQALGIQYQLDRELGRGGMGVVFEATDRTLDRRVAIKVVHPALTHQEGIVRRFLDEARLIAKFRHPGIVAVHAAGEADGLLYYVMDRVEGETLRDRLRREPNMSVDDARRITADVAMALDAARGRPGASGCEAREHPHRWRVRPPHAGGLRHRPRHGRRARRK
jgi:serine/threonine-protein kinase